MDAAADNKSLGNALVRDSYACTKLTSTEIEITFAASQLLKTRYEIHKIAGLTRAILTRCGNCQFI